MKSIDQSGISVEIADRIKLQFTSNEIVKLGVREYLLAASSMEHTVNNSCADRITMNTCKIPQNIRDNLESAIDSDSSSNHTSSLDDPHLALLSGNQYDISIDDEEDYVTGFDEMEEEQMQLEECLAVSGDTSSFSRCVDKTLLQVFREWLGCPETLGITEAAFTKLFELMHFYKPTFTDADLKCFPTTGKGLVYLNPKYFENIKFRNLSEYREETDDYPEIVAQKKRVPVRKKVAMTIANVKLFAERDNLAVAATNNSAAEAAAGSDSDDEDKTSVRSVICNSSDDELCNIGEQNDGNEADDDDDEENNVFNKGPRNQSIPDLNEVECQVQEIDLGDMDGVDKQMELDEENNKIKQEMAYFGIENVLTGKNPGLIDHSGFENVLKAMMVLNNTVLSDFFVDKCFGEFDTIMVSEYNCT
jgi:hypothetical protein